MADQYYKDAQKIGQKEYRACVAAGLSPSLPVLDELVTPEQVLRGVDLGIMQVPTARPSSGRSGSASAPPI